MPCGIWFLFIMLLKRSLCPPLIWTVRPLTIAFHQGAFLRQTTTRHTSFQTLFTQRNLGTMADGFAAVALRAAQEGWSHEASLSELARLERE
jgi:hypothetical protein